MFYVTCELDHQILDENTSKSPFYNTTIILRYFQCSPEGQYLTEIKAHCLKKSSYRKAGAF